MKMTTGGFLVLGTLFVTLFAGGATGLAAQQGRRGPQPRGMEGRQKARQDGGIESIMRLRERLELTEDQMDQLDAIRRANVERRTADMVEMTEVQSQYAAGLIRRSDVMAVMEDQEEVRRGRAGQQRESLQAILTEGQQESLKRVRRESRASRGDGRRGQGGQGGFRSDRGQQRGSFRGDRRGSSQRGRGG